MILPLKDLELYFEDELIEQAERLVSDNKVKSLREIEKNFWVSYVEDTNVYEVEAIVTPLRVKAYTCECDEYKRKKICCHCICALLTIRNQHAGVTSHKRNFTPAKNSSEQKLNISQLLKQVNTLQLADFIAEYARSDTRFSLALKSRFITYAATDDTLAVYKNLLESASKPLLDKPGKAGTPNVHNLKIVLNQSLKNARHTINAGEYEDAADISVAVYQELLKLYSKKALPAFLNVYIWKPLEILAEVLHHETPVSLKEKIWESLFPPKLRFLDEHYYLMETFQKFYLPLAFELHREAVLLSFLDEYITKHRQEPDLVSSLLLIKLTIAYKSGSETLARQIIQENKDSPNLLLYAAEKAFELKNYDLAKTFCKQAQQSNADPIVREALDDLLLKTALITVDKPLIFSCAHRRLLKSLNPEFYAVLVENDCGEQFASTVIASIEALPFSKPKRNCLAAIYFYDKDWKKLLTFIEQMNSLELLILYDSYFQDDFETVEKLYKTLTVYYLSQHLGKQAATRIGEVLSHLIATARKGFSGELIRFLKKEYAERFSLMEELKNFTG